MSEPRSNVVTFVFTDVEGSTELLHRLGRDTYAEVLREHQALLERAFADHGGRVVDTQGDALFAAFDGATDAIGAIVTGQRALVAHDWPAGVEVRVRMGAHTGESSMSNGRYHGVSVHRAARICAAAHGGQVLVSQTTRDVLSDELHRHPDLELRDLGEHRLKDIAEATRLYQLEAEGLRSSFPPLRTTDAPAARRRRRRLVIAGAVATLGAAAAVGYLLVGRDDDTPVALLQDSLLAIDAITAKPIASIPVGTEPVLVNAAGQLVWVVNSGDNTVTAVDPSTLEVTRTVGLDGPGVGIAATDEIAWVAQQDHSVVRIEPELGSVEKISVATSEGCDSITSDGTRVWFLHGTELIQLDRAGDVVSRLALARPRLPTGQVVCYLLPPQRSSTDALWVLRDADSTLGRLDPRTADFQPVETPSQPIAPPDQDGGSLWVPNTRDAETPSQAGYLSRVDLANGTITSVTRIGKQARSIVAAPSGLWMDDPIDLVVRRIDPETQSVTAVVPIRHYPGMVDAGHGMIWVTLRTPGTSTTGS